MHLRLLAVAVFALCSFLLVYIGTKQQSSKVSQNSIVEWKGFEGGKVSQEFVEKKETKQKKKFHFFFLFEVSFIHNSSSSSIGSSSSSSSSSGSTRFRLSIGAHVPFSWMFPSRNFVQRNVRGTSRK